MNNMNIVNLFILEDDIEIRKIYERELIAHNFLVSTFGTIAEFTSALKDNSCDLCILDLSLPDGDALNTLKSIIDDYDLPTIIVTGRGSVSDKVLGLDFGADDYLVKPINILELAARIKSLLRRTNKTQESTSLDSTDSYRFNDWAVDFSKMKLTSPAQEEKALSVADANLLRAFLESPGKVLTREALLDICQLENHDVFDRSIDVRVGRLRKKLDDNQSTQIIKTVYGAGYLFTAQVLRK
jgi:DNA-binding response OmpR family regulator